jgi:hypothetical protein
MGDGLCELVVDDHCKLRHRRLLGAEDLFSIIGTTREERTNGAGDGGGGGSSAAMRTAASDAAGPVGARLAGNGRKRTGDEEKGRGGSAPVQKKHKGSAVTEDAAADEGEAKVSHITVERNRRKQMNEHLAVLRSLMPCFYVKRVRLAAYS